MLQMILNEKNCIFTQKGVEKKELLRDDQALIYQSPSKIGTMGYAGRATRIFESTTIPQKYCQELSRMKGFISLGTTGVGQEKEYKNVHVYSESAEHLDGVNRIGYLFPDGDTLKICEYKKGTRGSRYSSLYKILEEKLLEEGFTFGNESFLINENNVARFVDVINEINEEQNEGKYELAKSEEIDELSSGVFNIVYWRYKGEEKVEEPSSQVGNLTMISHDLITKIDTCNDVTFLTQLEQEINIIQGFCKSKIEALKLIQQDN